MNHTLNYGTGAFGGLRAYWNNEREQLYLFRPIDHFKRFAKSARLLRAELEIDPEKLRDIAERDLISVGLIQKGEVFDHFVRRIPYAYPVYDLNYQKHLVPIQEFIGGLRGIISTGRQGRFRYNNMDQSVEMGREVARELDRGEATDHEAIATGKEYFG